MNPDNPIARAVYIGMAAVAGAITALSFLQWREMTWGQILLTVFVGTSFAVFVVPWVTVDVLHVKDSLRTACGLTYIGGAVANAVVPKIARRVSAFFKLDEGVQP